jgi:hypothetical protein
LDRRRYRSAILITAAALTLFYVFILSKSGLLERLKLEEGKGRIVSHIENLKSENDMLRGRLETYRKGNYPDGDLLDAGYLRPGGKVVYFKGLKKLPRREREAPSEAGIYGVLQYLRIAWIAFSATLLIGLFLYGWRTRSDYSPYADS